MAVLSTSQSRDIENQNLKDSRTPPEHQEDVKSHSVPQIFTTGPIIFTMLATVGTFGSSRALAAFYAARQLQDGSFAPVMLAWAYSAFAIANIIALLWLVAFLYRSWMGGARSPGRPVFWSDFGILLGGGMSILCIIAGTLLISLALVQPSVRLQSVSASAYTTLAVVATMLIIATMRFAYVSIRG